MASSSREKCKSVASPVRTPSFIKEIEGHIVEMLKNCVANKLLLKVPDGEVWPIALTLDADTGSLWLEKGWPEFANFYSLENGCFLCFSYEGIHSCFNVRIFKKNSLEIDYPFQSSHHEEPNLCKPYGEAFSRATRFQSKRPFLAVKLHSSYIASPLKIQESFVNQYIFQGHMTRNLHLQIPDWGIWCAKCTVSLCGKHDYARIHGGWIKFAKDNNLQARNAIVPELMIEQQPEVTFRVHIFRA